MHSNPYLSETLRELAQRLEPQVKALERVKRDPNRREAYYLLVALDCLKAGASEDGLEAMLKAERVAPLPAAAARRGPHDATTTEDLRGRLKQRDRATMAAS
jgi:hypothetical protein